MKKLLLLPLLVISFYSNAQSVDISFGAGTGKSYLIESISQKTNARYGLPGAIFSQISFYPTKTSKWGVALTAQGVTSTVTGSDVITGISLNGYVSSFTTALLMQHENTKKNTTFGYNFGVGITNESIRPQRTNPSTTIENHYPSLLASIFTSYRMSKDFNLSISPMVMVHDPVKAVNYLYGKGGNLADEDISLFLNVAVCYHLF